MGRLRAVRAMGNGGQVLGDRCSVAMAGRDEAKAGGGHWGDRQVVVVKSRGR